MIDAARWAVATGYEDNRQQWREAPRDTIELILGSMGATNGGPPATRTQVVGPGEELDVRDAVRLDTEDGGSIEIDGGVPPDLPFGYHRLVHRDDSKSAVIVTPGTCFLPPDLLGWGWSVQLYSARRRGSWGIGDLTSLRHIAEWSRAQGAGIVMVNPLHAAAPGVQQASPYYPSSRRYRNPLYLDIGEVPGAREADLSDLEVQGRALNERNRIERDDVYRLKMNALRRLWPRFAEDPGFDGYIERQGESLHDYATYVALFETYEGGPSRWPEHYSHPRSPAVKRWRDDHRDLVRFHEWIQWLIERQLSSASDTIDVVHDLAVGVDPEGADAWVWQDVFASGMTVGAPPDEFSADGQGWGVPPFDPWKLAAAAYGPFVETLRAALSGASGLRIDHVMGLFRLFWIPDGADPAQGSYVHYPDRDLLGIVALESYRARAFVIGEDLGTVEPRVREEMSSRRMLSYRILWFEEDPPAFYPELALAGMTNHDLPTIAGVWTGAEPAELQRLGLEADAEAASRLRDRLVDRLGVEEGAATEDVIEAAYRSLGEAPSRLVVATLEDALAVETRPNQPGTTDAVRPNWSIPLPLPVEEIENHPLPRRIAASLGQRDHRPAR